MDEDQGLARANYEAHRVALASRYPYPPMPSWEHLAAEDRTAWIAGAEAVRVLVFTRLEEDEAKFREAETARELPGEAGEEIPGTIVETTPEDREAAEFAALLAEEEDEDDS